MANNYFQFKQFRIEQGRTAMKVGVDSVVLGSWVKLNNPVSILDVGTGTGLLALMMAQRTSDSQIVAVEVDADAVLDARDNFQQSSFASRLDLVHASIQDFGMLTDRRFDLIISNPPYFDNGNRSNYESRSTARHQDQLTLQDLISVSSALLTENGSLALVIPFDQREKLVGYAAENGLHLQYELVICPTPEKAQNRVAMQFGFVGGEIDVENLIIRNKGAYTDEYKELTAAFYLK